MKNCTRSRLVRVGCQALPGAAWGHADADHWWVHEGGGRRRVHDMSMSATGFLVPLIVLQFSTYRVSPTFLIGYQHCEWLVFYYAPKLRQNVVLCEKQISVSQNRSCSVSQNPVCWGVLDPIHFHPFRVGISRTSPKWCVVHNFLQLMWLRLDVRAEFHGLSQVELCQHKRQIESSPFLWITVSFWPARLGSL
jgi:hypothetical protein